MSWCGLGWATASVMNRQRAVSSSTFKRVLAGSPGRSQAGTLSASGSGVSVGRRREANSWVLVPTASAGRPRVNALGMSAALPGGGVRSATAATACAPLTKRKWTSASWISAPSARSATPATARSLTRVPLRPKSRTTQRPASK